MVAMKRLNESWKCEDELKLSSVSHVDKPMRKIQYVYNVFVASPLCYFVLFPLSHNLYLASFSLFQFRRKCFLAGSFVLGKKYSGGINNLSRSEYQIQRRVQGKRIIRSCWHSQKTIRIRWAAFVALWRDESSVVITKQDLVIVCKLRITLSGDNFRCDMSINPFRFHL